jgi:predicted ATPase
LIHIPGLRGNPERSYPVSAVENDFPGAFQNYVASIIRKWQEDDPDKLTSLANYLKKLGLTSVISAEPINDAQVELRVGRTMNGNAKNSDMVNIADVGFGVSQTLPVLVALLVARPGQLVYLEQPEIHLHPRAQVVMAEILADAAQREVRVVTETHSDLLVLSIQTLVAEGKLSPELVKLHWFKRNEKGVTEVTTANLDKAGAYGDWPEDFALVRLKAESRYLDAAESQMQVLEK